MHARAHTYAHTYIHTYMYTYITGATYILHTYIHTHDIHVYRSGFTGGRIEEKRIVIFIKKIFFIKMNEMKINLLNMLKI